MEGKPVGDWSPVGNPGAQYWGLFPIFIDEVDLNSLIRSVLQFTPSWEGVLIHLKVERLCSAFQTGWIDELRLAV